MCKNNDNMNCNKFRLIATFVLCISLFANAQDPHFSQFYSNPLYLNPAFAGTTKCPRVSLNYRNQWGTLSAPFETYSASFDKHFDEIHGGIGAYILRDNQAYGQLKTTSFHLMYSYLLRATSKISFKFALQAGGFQKALDKSKLKFGDMIDARRGFIHYTQESLPVDTKSGLDFGGGFLMFTDNLYFGAAFHHITQPDEGLLGISPLPLKITGHVGYSIPLKKSRPSDVDSYVSFNLLYMNQSKFNYFNAGVYFVRGLFTGGIWYRHMDAVIIMAGLQLKDYKIGYSYDVTTSNLALKIAGAHEVSISTQLKCKPKTRKFRTTSCPAF